LALRGASRKSQSMTAVGSGSAFCPGGTEGSRAGAGRAYAGVGAGAVGVGTAGRTTARSCVAGGFVPRADAGAAGRVASTGGVGATLRGCDADVSRRGGTVERGGAGVGAGAVVVGTAGRTTARSCVAGGFVARADAGVAGRGASTGGVGGTLTGCDVHVSGRGGTSVERGGAGVGAGAVGGGTAGRTTAGSCVAGGFVARADAGATGRGASTGGVGATLRGCDADVSRRGNTSVDGGGAGVCVLDSGCGVGGAADFTTAAGRRT
jgi:hypothetical protein